MRPPVVYRTVNGSKLEALIDFQENLLFQLITGAYSEDPIVLDLESQLV